MIIFRFDFWLRYISSRDELVRHAGLIFIGNSLFNLFNLLYHLFMVRALTPVEYGHLNAVIALFTIISVPATTVQTTVTRFVYSFQVQR